MTQPYAMVTVPFMRIDVIDTPKDAPCFDALPDLYLDLVSADTGHPERIFLRNESVMSSIHGIDDEVAKKILVTGLETCLQSPEMIARHGQLLLGTDEKTKLKNAGNVYNKILPWKTGPWPYSYIRGSGLNPKRPDGYRLTLNFGRSIFLRAYNCPYPESRAMSNDGSEFTGMLMLFGELKHFIITHNNIHDNYISARRALARAVMQEMISPDRVYEEIVNCIDLNFAGLRAAGFIKDIVLDPLVKE